MSDLKIIANPDGSASVPIVNGDLVLVEGDDAIIQDVSQLLFTHEGETVYDLDEGLPWIEVLREPGPIAALVPLLTSEVQAVEGVTITSVPTAERDGSTLSITMTISVGETEATITGTI